MSRTATITLPQAILFGHESILTSISYPLIAVNQRYLAPVHSFGRVCSWLCAHLLGKSRFHEEKSGEEERGGEGFSYLMQGGEAVFVAEVRAHVIPQQVAHWREKGMEKDTVKHTGWGKNITRTFAAVIIKVVISPQLA